MLGRRKKKKEDYPEIKVIELVEWINGKPYISLDNVRNIIKEIKGDDKGTLGKILLNAFISLIPFFLKNRKRK